MQIYILPGPKDALVAFAYSGINFIDVYFRTGLYKAEAPIALGNSTTRQCVVDERQQCDARRVGAQCARPHADRLKAVVL